MTDVLNTVLNTVDYILPNGATCYGRDNCQWLAQNDPGNAIRNADNYTFYMMDVIT